MKYMLAKVFLYICNILGVKVSFINITFSFINIVTKKQKN